MLTASLLYCLVGGAVVYAMTRGLGPASTVSSVPIRGADGGLVLTESYWLIAIMQLFYFFIGFGFYWAVHDLPGGASTWWTGIPCYLIGVVGFGRLFFRRRHRFFPQAKRVVVEGFSIWRGRFTESFRYTEVACRIERRRIGNTYRHCCMYVYPNLEVAFAMRVEEQEARDRMRALVIILGMPEAPNKAPEPTPSSVTPRATESMSK